jgi:gliding motility-associated-like protein
MRRFFLSLFFFVPGLSSLAQLTVDNSLTVEAYVQNILLGAGVTVSNITFNGLPGNTVTLQVGSFNGENSNVGISSGMILASGDVNVAEGPNQSGSNTLEVGPWPAGSGVSDPDLQAINPGYALNDAAVLEFDFIPNGDTLKFSYVFGSDEYPEFVNSSFNDVFGFFLSGPGLNGPYQNNAVNIAIVPGTALPVTIDNVNNGWDGINGPCTNCVFYNHNGTGYWDPFWGGVGQDSLSFYDPYHIGFDGFTDPLEALAEVVCGETYHIKIAVADAGDQAYDSAVFLEEGSFASNSIVDVQLEITVGTSEGLLYEECGQALLTFTRSAASNADVEDLVLVTYGGEAVNGVDYSLLPDSIIFPAGVEQVTFSIDAFVDGSFEGDETVIMNMLNVAACNGNGVESNFEFTITEVPDLEAEGAVIYHCYGEDVEIGPAVWGGYGHYVYSWNDGYTDSSRVVSPEVPTTYYVTVSDTCDQVDVNVEIFVNVTPPVDIDAGLDQVVSCIDNALLQATVIDGVPDFTYSWTINGISISNQQSATYTTDEDVTITVSVSDECGNSASDELELIVYNPPIEIELDDYVYASCIQNSSITADISGGSGDLDITWLAENQVIGSEAEVMYNAEESLFLYLLVTDACGGIANDSIFIDTSTNPPLVELGADIFASCVDVSTVFADISGGQPGYNVEWFADGQLLGTGISIQHQTDFTTEVEVLVTDVCGFTGNDSVTIHIPNIPLELEYSPDTAICLGSNIALFAQASGGEGGFEYFWHELEEDDQWVQVAPDGPEVYTITATDICGKTITRSIEVDVQFVNAHIETEYLTETLVQFTGIPFPEPCENCSYAWSFGDGAGSAETNPLHEFPGLQDYVTILEITNAIGCYGRDYTVIDPPIYMYVPNSFTPDGDGINEEFRAVASGVTEFQMWIYNRWGELVFYSNDIGLGWSGDLQNGELPVQDGVYNWRIRYKGVNLVEYERRGHVNALR